MQENIRRGRALCRYTATTADYRIDIKDSGKGTYHKINKKSLVFVSRDTDRKRFNDSEYRILCIRSDYQFVWMGL